MKIIIMIFVFIFFLSGCDMSMNLGNWPEKEWTYYYAKIKVETESGEMCKSAEVVVDYDPTKMLGITWRPDTLGFTHPYKRLEGKSSIETVICKVSVYKYGFWTANSPVWSDSVIFIRKGSVPWGNPNPYEDIDPIIVVFPDES